MPGRALIDVRPAAPRLADVGAVEQLPAGAVLRIELEDVALAVVNDGGQFRAVRDLCLRCSRALSAGTLTGGQLTCGGCGWKYDLARGCVVGLPALRMEVHEVRIVDGRVRVTAAIEAVAESAAHPPT